MKPLGVKKQETPTSQRSIKSFFTATMSTDKESNKRKSTESEDKEGTKKVKKEEEATEACKEHSTPLTPDQKKMVGEKQIVARLRLASKSNPLITPTIGPSWYTKILEREFQKPYFLQLSNFYNGEVSKGTTVFPPREDIFSWTRHCELESVKVVIIGQDPYHNVGQAHGLCFSVKKGIQSPPSLLNMYKELVRDEEVQAFVKVPSHGHLVGWAEQGVLLLNSVLTVQAHKANSHQSKGWETLTTSVISWIAANLNQVVFLLWGASAQKMGLAAIGRHKARHTILQTTHPSPLSAHRGFLGCGHFSQCNEALVSAGKEPIKWEYLP